MSGVRARLETEELQAVRCVRYVYVAVHGSLGCHLGVSFWYEVGAKQNWFEVSFNLVLVSSCFIMWTGY